MDGWMDGWTWGKAHLDLVGCLLLTLCRLSHAPLNLLPQVLQPPPAASPQSHLLLGQLLAPGGLRLPGSGVLAKHLRGGSRGRGGESGAFGACAGRPLTPAPHIPLPSTHKGLPPTLVNSTSSR